MLALRDVAALADMSALIMGMPHDNPSEALSARQQRRLAEYCRLVRSKPLGAGGMDVRTRPDVRPRLDV